MEKEYIKSRIEEQADWHSEKAKKYKRYYFIFMTINIIVSASIPVISVISTTNPNFNIIIAIMGAMVTITSGLVGLFQYYNNWTKYRLTSENLKRNLYLYLTKVKPFDKEDRFEVLVQITEDILADNNAKWREYHSSSKDINIGDEKNVGIQS